MSLGNYRLTSLAKAPALYTGLQVSPLACSYYLEYPKLPFVSSTAVGRLASWRGLLLPTACPHPSLFAQ